MSLTQSPTTRTSIEQKLKAKNCALILKNGSPKLRDLLRERCHTRMKESRADAFSSGRNIPMERKRLINTIVREELQQEIDDDIELHDIIVKEIIEKWEQWQNEEFENAMEWMMAAESEQQVCCPVCERQFLTLQENIISCLCGLRLYYPKTLPEFHQKLQTSLKSHEQMNCYEKLLFLAEPKFGFNVLALNAICPACNFYTPIIELM